MAHGWRSMVINTQERALSVDINRLQRFKEQDLAELFRHMLDVYATSDDDQLGLMVEPNTVETPLRAEIINGLLVKPQAGSLNLLVDPGVAMVMAPDSATDESNYKYIRDEGVLTAGALAMGANASGSTRIDVIECRVNPTPSSVTDSRDIFNATTGLFAAATVTKEQRGRLEYRVRQGTPGSGFPANQSGWLPLCVASVPNGATTCDQMTFWDVRPLVKDRETGLVSRVRALPNIEHLQYAVDCETAAGQARMKGSAIAFYKGRMLGGRLRRGTPGTDEEYVDLEHADNLAQGFTITGSGYAYFYLLTPFGLPRWARYTTGPSGRVPRSPCGIMVVTNVAPQHLTNAPSAAINLPSSTGLGGSTTDGICVGTARQAGAGALDNLLASGKTILPDSTYTSSIAADSYDTTQAQFTMTEGTTYPAGAKEILVYVDFVYNVPANSVININCQGFQAAGPGLTAIQWQGQNILPASDEQYTNVTAGAKNGNVYRRAAWIPVWPQFTNAPATWKLRMGVLFTAVSGTNATVTQSTMAIRGVRY